MAEVALVTPAPNRDAGLVAALEEGLLTCVHCGLCLPACPTYRILGDENDSPRGRLYLLRAQLEGREGGSGARRMHLGRCLGCRACETVCPAGVPYGALLERERADRLQGRPAAARWGRAVLWMLTGRGIGRFLCAGLRLIRGAGAARWAGRVIAGRAGLAARLLDATRPRSGALRRLVSAPATVSSPTASPDVSRPGEGQDAPGTAPRSYALLEGCVMRGLFGHVHEASRAALSEGGFTERSAPRQSCCGALHAHAGHLSRARQLAKRNIAAFEADDADYIVADAAGCGAALRQYREWLEDDPRWADAAARFSDRVRDVMELVAEGADTGGSGAQSTSRCPAGSTGELDSQGSAPRVGYDAPCHLLHAQRVDSAPFVALRARTGLEMEPLPSSSDCCGGAGLYNLFHSGLSARILERKVDEIRAGRYDAVATGNPGCIMQIGAGLYAAGLAIPVVHPVELLRSAGLGLDS